MIFDTTVTMVERQVQKDIESPDKEVSKFSVKDIFLDCIFSADEASGITLSDTFTSMGTDLIWNNFNWSKNSWDILCPSSSITFLSYDV